MATLRTLMNVALGYGARPEHRAVGRFQAPGSTHAYGPHRLQAFDFYPAGTGEAPLLVFVHGGAWRFGDKARRLRDRKADFAKEEGWHFAALNFRLFPEVDIGIMAEDLGAAIAAIFGDSEALGIDRERIVVMGHSSGAHLATLVATDTRLLGGHGMSPDRLRGVIAVDGAAYDLREPSAGRLLEMRLVAPAFPFENRPDLSPVLHAEAGPNARAFLVLHSARRQAERQARLLETALLGARTQVSRRAFPGRGAGSHVAMSRRLGEHGFGPTEAARAFLRRIASL